MTKQPNSSWSTRKSLVAQVQKLWDKGTLLQELALVHSGEESIFPKRLLFKTPNSDHLVDEFDRVRDWITDIRSLTGIRIGYKRIRHRILGTNDVPIEAWLDDVDSAITLIGKSREAALYQRLVEQTKSRLPALLPWLIRHPLKVLVLADQWHLLLDFVSWRSEHARPNIYLRQVSIKGIDTKLIEQNKTVLASMLDVLLPEEEIDHKATGIKGFEQRYGFRGKSVRIRFRLLDAELGSVFGLAQGLDYDLALTDIDFQSLGTNAELLKQLQRVFITENEINFLTFPDVSKSIVIFGSGYGFEALGQAHWLSSLALYYWGDIDTHGFAILNQLRTKLPSVQSFLMDEKTLTDHACFWSTEDKPTVAELVQLNDEEQRLYYKLVDNVYQERLRLEQERISYDSVCRAIAVLTPSEAG